MLQTASRPTSEPIPQPEDDILLLFHEEHKQKIIDGKKDETRRLWKPNKARPKIGAIHLAYTRPPWVKKNPGKPFAKLLILDVYKELLGMIGPASVVAEGYKYYMDFVKVWIKINGCWDGSQIIDVVKFKVVEVLDG